MPPQWLLGVLLCLCGAAFTNLGLTLQKLSFLRTDALHPPPSPSPPACCQPLWLLGFSIFLVGQVGGMIAMGFSSQSVVATLGSFSLVTNCIFAPLILKEQMTALMGVSIAVIMLGSGVVVLSSNHDNQDYTLDELLQLFRRDTFLIYCAALALCLALCAWMMVREQRREAKEGAVLAHSVPRSLEGEVETGEAVSSSDSEGPPVVSLSLPSSPRKPLLSPSASFESTESDDTGGSQSPTTASAPHLTLPLGTPPLSSLTPTLTAAILSSVSVLLGKCTMQLIKTSVTTADNQFTSPLSFVISTIFIVAAIGSVHLLNTGLRRGTALFVVPFYYVSSTSLAIVGGLVYFEEFARFSAVQMLVFFGGVGLTVLGVWISTRGQMEEEEREAEEEEAEEEREVMEEADIEAQLRREEEEEHKSATLTPPSRSSPSTPSPRTSTASSPRSSFTPRQPAILEEEVQVLDDTSIPTAAEEERESAKRRRWHQKRAVSEPRLSFILPSPSRAEHGVDGRYGSFTTAAPSSSSSAAASDATGTLPAIQSPPLLGMSGPSARAGRTQSMSMAEPARMALHAHQHHRQLSESVVGGSVRRAYTPHYTLAFYPLLPSNPQGKRKSRSASVAASRQLSPQATPTRRLRL